MTETCILPSPYSTQVRIVLTDSAKHFWSLSENYQPKEWADFHSLQPSPPIFTDRYEWDAWKTLGDPVMHIQVQQQGPAGAVVAAAVLLVVVAAAAAAAVVVVVVVVVLVNVVGKGTYFLVAT